jgi:hypothetical protein
MVHEADMAMVPSKVCFWEECVAKARFVAGVVATGILTLGFSASR